MQIETKAFHRIVLDVNTANIVYNKTGAKEVRRTMVLLKERIDARSEHPHNKLAEETKKGDC